MDNLFLLLALTSIIALFVALINPLVFQKVFKDKATRKKLSIYFIGSTFIFFILFGVTIEPTKQIEEVNIPTTTNKQEETQVGDKTELADTKPNENTDIYETKNDEYKEIPIPSSRAGDKGKYYLMKYEIVGNLIKALHKRIGVDSTGYTTTETNCQTMQIRDLGYSEESPLKIIEKPSEWYELVSGSSKSDLANFLCKNYYQ